MSYFSNNKLFHYYEITDNNILNDHIVKDTIEILNNEKIRFDFSKLQVYAPIHGVLNSTGVETIKIAIDWGDGSIDRLSKPLVSNKSTIGTYRPNSWKTVEHLFNVEKRYEYKTDDIKYLHKITITAYNSFNDKMVIEIPYKILYKTIYDLGSELSMFSANTTNTNKVSYTLKQKATDSMFVVNSLDWRTIYGDDDNVVIEETVSEVFSDEFVNEDIMVWDWKTPPSVVITDVNDIFAKTIKCNFTVGDIPIDEWHPQMLLKQDRGDIRVDVVKVKDEEVEGLYKNEYEAVFEYGKEYIKVVTFNEYPIFPDDYNFKSGIYETYLNPLVGINGVSTRSDSHFFSYNLPYRPKNIQKVDNVEIFTIDETNTNDITFTFTLPWECQLSTLTKAELTLNAFKKDNNNNPIPIQDIVFTHDILTPLFNELGQPLYVVNGTEPIFTYSIKMRDIPNVLKVDYVDGEEIKTREEQIYYVPSIAFNDVLGGDDNTIIRNSIGEEQNLIDISFNNYSIGHFTDDDLIISDIDQDTKNFTITWKFLNKDEWDQFIINVLRNNEYLITNVYEHDKENEFYNLVHNEIKDDGGNIISHEYTATISSNAVADGELFADVIYRVYMGDYYDWREKTLNKNFTLTYPTPILTITDIQPYYSINYNTLNGEQSLVLNAQHTANSNGEKLKNISLRINERTPIVLTDLTYSHRNIGFNDNTFNYVYNAANENDLFNRLGESNVGTLTYNGLVRENESDVVPSLNELPNGGVDYLEGDASSMFVNLDGIPNDNGEYPTVDWLWVKQNTLHDINKHYKWTIGDLELFGGQRSDMFKFGEETRHALYKIINLKRGEETIRRFMPYIASGTLDISNRAILDEATSKFNTDTTFGLRSYDRNNDRGVIDISWTNQDIAKVKNMWLTLTKGGEDVQTVDIKNLTAYKFSNLELANDYGYYITLDSEYNRTESNIHQGETISTLITPEESIIFSSQPIVSVYDADKSFITWRWTLYNVSCEDVKLYYTDEKTKVLNEYKYVKNQPSIQPSPFYNTTDAVDEDGTAQRNVVTYGFKIKSPFIDTTGYDADEDGYITVHENSITL